MAQKIGIITVIKPLYAELLLQSFTVYLESSEFLCLCNKLGITEEYIEAYNAAVEREKLLIFSCGPAKRFWKVIKVIKKSNSEDQHTSIIFLILKQRY